MLLTGKKDRLNANVCYSIKACDVTEIYAMALDSNWFSNEGPQGILCYCNIVNSGIDQIKKENSSEIE